MSNSTAFNPFAVIDESHEEIPNELAASCKKVFKKDVATRLKGLQEISSWITLSHSITAFKDDFLKIYLEVSMDPDRQVREAVQKLLGQVIKSHRSFLKPLIKTIGPKILGSLFDPVPTVSEASIISFTELIKDDKVVAFCGLIEKDLVSETLEACNGSLVTLEERLKLMGEDQRNINYSCDLYLHNLIRALMFASSKMGKSIETLPGMDLKGITLFSLDSLRGTRSVFMRQTLYRFLLACSPHLIVESYYGRLDDLIGLLRIEHDGVSLVSLLSHLENLLETGLIGTSKFQPEFLKFCSKLAADCTSQIGNMTMKILSKFYQTPEALNSLECNFKSRVYVETDHIKPFIELYVEALSKFGVGDAGLRRNSLYKIVLEERLPLSALSLTYYLDLFLKTWNDDEFTDLLVDTLGKSTNPTKLPLSRMWENKKVQELCFEIINTSPITDVSKIISLTRNTSSIEALSSRLSKLTLTENDAIMILKLGEKESIHEIFDQAAAKFANLNVEDQEDVLLRLDQSLWTHLFKDPSDYSTLKQHLLGNDLMLGIKLSSIVAGPVGLELTEILLHFDATHHNLDDDDCAALLKLFSVKRDVTGLNALVSLVYDHGQQLLVPSLQRELTDFDTDLLAGLVEISFSKPKVFELLNASLNIKLFTDLVCQKLTLLHHHLIIESFNSAAGFVLDNLSSLSASEASHVLAVVIREIFTRLDSDYLFSSLKHHHRSDLIDLTGRLSACLCADVSFNDQRIAKWITGGSDGNGLIPLMLNEIAVSPENLVNLYSLLRCTSSDSFKQKYFIGGFVPSADIEVTAAIYAIISSDDIDVSDIFEALPEDINEDDLVKLVLVLAQEEVSRKLSIRSDLLSYVLQRYSGDAAFKLMLIANTCHYGRVNVGFWDSWTNDLTQSIDFGLNRFETFDDLDALKRVLRIAGKYVSQESAVLAPYYQKLFDIWTRLGATHQKCGLVKELTGMMSIITRQHITASFKILDSTKMLDIFSNSTDIHDLLVVRFFMALKIDETLEALKVEVAKDSGTRKLFPGSDLSVLFRKETYMLRKLLLVDMFLSYLEGASDAAGLSDLYNEALQEISPKAIGICLGLLCWDTKTPFDLNKHEFVAIDSEEVLCSESEYSIKIYAASLFARIVKSAPSAARNYHASLPKERRILFEKHFTNFMSPIMTARELSRLKRYEKSSPNDALKIKVLQTSTNCAVQAQYTLEDLSVELGLQVPSSFPLEPITVTGGKRLGLSETKWRSWILSCQTVFKSDSISILDGLLHWKRNVEKSLEGMEPCPICYCIFHPSDKTLPGPSCKTCNNKYHSSCLYKWFKSSGNATCAMCRAVF